MFILHGRSKYCVKNITVFTGAGLITSTLYLNYVLLSFEFRLEWKEI